MSLNASNRLGLRRRESRESRPRRSCRRGSSGRDSLIRSPSPNRLDLAPPAQRARQRAAVDVLELAANGHAVRDAARPHAVLVRERRDEVCGRIAFHRHARRQDHLRESLLLETPLEQLETELARPNAVDRRQMSHQHEVASAVRARLLDREQVGRRLDDAELPRVAPIARAEAAERFFRQHATALAVADRAQSPRRARSTSDRRRRDRARANRTPSAAPSSRRRPAGTGGPGSVDSAAANKRRPRCVRTAASDPSAAQDRR